jgi:hypothetical protein
MGNEDYLRNYLWVLPNLFSIATILNTMVLTYDRYMTIVHPRSGISIQSIVS